METTTWCCIATTYEIDIPRLARSGSPVRQVRWEPSDIRELVRSIFLDYYIGSLLLWRGTPANFETLTCEPLHGFRGNGSRQYIVLDGQQRLTAMYYAFMAPPVPSRRRKNRFLYFIRVNRFMEEAYDDAFEYDWTRRGRDLLKDRSAQFAAHLFPLAVLGQEDGFELAFWVKDYEQYWRRKETEADSKKDLEAARQARRHAENAKAFGQHVKEISQKYYVSYIELDRELEISKVCDIFTQINSRGIRLDIFDLLNALLRPKKIELKQRWREAAPKLAFVRTDRMNVYVLQVMSILLQAYCSPKYLYFLIPGERRTIRADGSLAKKVLVPDVADFERRWHEAVEALEDAIRLLRQPQGFWSDLGAVPTLRLHTPRLGRVAGEGSRTSTGAPAQGPPQDWTMVLGKRLH